MQSFLLFIVHTYTHTKFNKLLNKTTTKMLEIFLLQNDYEANKI